MAASFADAFAGAVEDGAMASGEVLREAPVRVNAGIIGATRRTLSDIREERDSLRARLDGAEVVSELDPQMIDPSPIRDRLPDDDDAAFRELKRLIAEEGQQVPIKVRRSPAQPDRFQVVYGHRRLRAAQDLVRNVKAIIVEATDPQLAVAQGLENNSRQDLTWIEKALFAWRMEALGIKAREIRAALAVDDGELARYRAVCRALPAEIIEGIGRAPKVGRPRWSELVESYTTNGRAEAVVRKTLAADKVRAVSSDERFRQALAALKEKVRREDQSTDLKTGQGPSIGRVSFTGTAIKLSLAKGEAKSFAEFFQAELPDLLQRYAERNR